MVLLGTMTLESSLVVIIVDRIEIFLTIPINPSNSTKSPTFTGLSKSSVNPLTKLVVKSWIPKPIPTPNPPATTAKEARLNPISWMAIITPKATIK